jgi:hypothetical protein
MADFDPPWSSVGGVNRSPTTNEQSDGFQCGDADLTLFNRLFGRIEAELKAVQDAGGITGTEGDDTTVLQAINALISAATGGGDVSQFVLFSQAQARLPIFPEVTTNGGVIAVTSPSTGTIRVPASATILHRGIRTYTTAQTDFATTASKTYHLRWNPTDGFSLKDLADTGYNPTVSAETNAAFDSSYDDMLVARVVTNSSNVPTITNLKNKAVLADSLTLVGSAVANNGGNESRFAFASANYNWARTPINKAVTDTAVGNNGAVQDQDISYYASYPTTVTSIPATRYNSSFQRMHDYATSLTLQLDIRAL